MSYIRFVKERLKSRRTLLKLKKVQANNASSPSFFILSAGRSGSTLMRKELIEQCDVIIPPESEDMVIKVTHIYFEEKDYNNKVKAILHFLKSQSYMDFWSINYGQLEEQLETSEKSLPEVIEAIYQTQRKDHKQSDSIIGDKTPFLNYYLKEIHTLFPNAKLIYLIRDPRAVIASYIKNRDHSLDQAIHRWHSSIKTYLKYKAIFGENVIEIKYENYIRDNENTTQQIVEFLELPMRSEKIQIEAANLGDTHLPHHKNINNPINNEAIDKWKSQLTNEQIAEIDKKLTPLLNQFNYSLNQVKK